MGTVSGNKAVSRIKAVSILIIVTVFITAVAAVYVYKFSIEDKPVDSDSSGTGIKAEYALQKISEVSGVAPRKPTQIDRVSPTEADKSKLPLRKVGTEPDSAPESDSDSDSTPSNDEGDTSGDDLLISLININTNKPIKTWKINTLTDENIKHKAFTFPNKKDNYKIDLFPDVKFKYMLNATKNIKKIIKYDNMLLHKNIKIDLFNKNTQKPIDTRILSLVTRTLQKKKSVGSETEKFNIGELLNKQLYFKISLD